MEQLIHLRNLLIPKIDENDDFSASYPEEPISESSRAKRVAGLIR
jgi:hypothetical protein